MPTQSSKPWTPEEVLALFERSLGQTSVSALQPEAFDAVAALLKSAAPESQASLQSQVDKLLQGFSKPQRETKPLPIVSDLRRAFRLSAAVLTAFDPYRLKPFGMTAKLGSAAAELADLVSVYAPPSAHQRWMLRPDVRDEALAGLDRDQLVAALEANEERPSTPVQQQVEALIRGSDPLATESQSLSYLTTLYQATLQAVRWLQATQSLIDQTRVPAVFSKMAGSTFVDRTSELKLLRDYVGVLPPSTGLETIRRQFRQWFKLTEKPPLFIYAPGGTGKTALVSRFILEHMNVPAELKFPYIYFDFDNPSLRSVEPQALFDEATRQIVVQYPDAQANLRDLRDDARAQSSRPAVTEAFDSLDRGEMREHADTTAFAARFAAVLGQVVTRTQTDGPVSVPLLLVLDTYEEVQMRGLDQELRLWTLIDEVQKSFPTLRTVVCGRALVERTPTKSITMGQLVLGEFGVDVAVIFLSKLGVEDPAVARSIYRQVGGNPLNLMLAAEVYRKEGIPSDRLSVISRALQRFTAGESLVQGQLYQRILGHIHNPDVRRLAHPGFMLRVITPDLIQNVLQGPCSVSVPDATRAKMLFDELRQEVALVVSDDEGVRLRSELRPLMLKLLLRDSPGPAAEINRLAVEYYSRKEGPQARAEEIYHRLQLGQTSTEVAPRWLQGIDSYLFNALDELPPQGRVVLAALLGVRMSDKDLKTADTATWETYTARRVGEMLRLGSVQEALAMLRERSERTPGSPLHLLEARALALLGRLNEADRALRKAIDAAAESGDRSAMLEALLLSAQLAQDAGDVAGADAVLREATTIAEVTNDALNLVLILSKRLQMRVAFPTGLPEDLELRPGLAQRLDALSDVAWAENKELVRAAVSLLGLEYASLLQRLLKRVGLGAVDSQQAQLLARAIEGLADDPAVRAITEDYAKTIGWPEAPSPASADLLRALQQAGRLDEYLERLLPILFEHRECWQQASQMLARIYLPAYSEMSKDHDSPVSDGRRT